MGVLKVITQWLRGMGSEHSLQFAWPFLLVILCSNIVWHGAVVIVDRKTSDWHMERHPQLEHRPGDLNYSEAYRSRHIAVKTDTLAQCEARFVTLSVEYKPACLRIAEQAASASALSEHHFWITRFYNIRYFACLLTAFGMGTFAAGGLLMVSRRGWEHCDPRVLSATIALSIGTALYSGLPKVMMMSENIEDNERAYIIYDNVGVGIRSFVLTGESSGGMLEPVEFIHVVDKVFEDNNGIHIRFDETATDAGATQLRSAAAE